ncbi:PadR family transcriptional regulator [Streptomyces sp. 4.24]|uniref:PadR family transcriptional regulator n=1 Tax=Streptomyces tritrimontium TaxID=3406573 RepID=UPI003BB5843D
MSMDPALATTSYAILGLLAVRPWSTYELARQMDRSLGRIWPRAQSKLYEEPKELVRHGLAEATREAVGRRPRTVYRITAEGRRALADWLPEPSAGPVLESEQLLKVFSPARHRSRNEPPRRCSSVASSPTTTGSSPPGQSGPPPSSSSGSTIWRTPPDPQELAEILRLASWSATGEARGLRGFSLPLRPSGVA